MTILFIYVTMAIQWGNVNTFGLVKTISDMIFDMIVATFHHEPLIFNRAT